MILQIAVQGLLAVTAGSEGFCTTSLWGGGAGVGNKEGIRKLRFGPCP